jgi:hypothetical protein
MRGGAVLLLVTKAHKQEVPRRTLEDDSRVIARRRSWN